MIQIDTYIEPMPLEDYRIGTSKKKKKVLICSNFKVDKTMVGLHSRQQTFVK